MNPLLRLYYLAEYVVVTSLLAVLAWVPLRVTLGFGDLVAWICFLAMPRRRAIAIDNILRAGVCAGSRDARRLALASFRTFVAMIVETNAARRRLTPENWREHVRFMMTPEAERLLHQPDQGLIVASAHFGNWEVVARAASMIKPVSAIYRPFNNPYLDHAARTGRSGSHLHLISKFDANPMRFMQTLARGDILAIMMDQHAGKDGVLVDFFGRKAWTTRTVALLHLTTRYPLLLAFALRMGPLRYDVQVLGPFKHLRSGDREKDIAVITQELTNEIEKVARARPEEYMWGHRRWKGTASLGVGDIGQPIQQPAQRASVEVRSSS